MPLFEQNITIILPYTPDEVFTKLDRITMPPHYEPVEGEEEHFLFNGTVKENSFYITRRLSRPQNFLPIMRGTLEKTSMGSLLFIRASLFNSTKLFFLFGFVFCIVMALFFAFIRPHILYASVFGILTILNYLTVTLNIRRQIKISRNLLEKQLFTCQKDLL